MGRRICKGAKAVPMGWFLGRSGHNVDSDHPCAGMLAVEGSLVASLSSNDRVVYQSSCLPQGPLAHLPASVAL